MSYNIGTVTTTANGTKVTGTNTKWKDNNSRVSAEQVILILNGTTAYINSIQSIQSDTELTLSFPAPVAVKNGTYNILTTMVNSVSDAANKIVAMNVANVQFSDIVNRLATETGVIEVVLPDGTKKSMKTFAEMDKQLDGKVDKTTGEMESITVYKKRLNYPTLRLKKDDGSTLYLESKPDEQPVMAQLYERGPDGKIKYSISFPKSMGTAMQVGDYGFGGNGSGTGLWANWTTAQVQDFFKTGSSSIWRNQQESTPYGARYGASMYVRSSDTFWNMNVNHSDAGVTLTSGLTGSDPSTFKFAKLYSTLNTTKDSNGNLKAASPVVKLFADNIELNDESEGVEMEHLGIGHYLIKGVVGFNADGAWGINNGFVIPQDHNGKNMVLIDYEVRPDGDIEVFVFHQQNADMPERFQNKRIKHFDEEGVPVYFENYEPCDVPESRWIDMRVEMPPNSLYNQKQAEAERLAKLEAERLAQEEAKRAAEEAERAEQEDAERKQYGLDDNSVLL
ncbi:phage tail fiber protein [Providencia hangzhouensis]